MSCTNQLHASFGDGASRFCLQLTSYLVDDNHFWHVVFHRLDHYLVLETGTGHLHTPRLPDGWVGDIPVACDFVGGVYYDHPFLFSQDSCRFSQQGGFAHPWPS